MPTDTAVRHPVRGADYSWSAREIGRCSRLAPPYWTRDGWLTLALRGAR